MLRLHYVYFIRSFFFVLPAGDLSDQGEWVLAERWRGVERPLPPDVPVLHVLAAWGDARHEVVSLFKIINASAITLIYFPD